MVGKSRKRMVNLLMSGKTQKEVANIVGVSQPAVSLALKNPKVQAYMQRVAKTLQETGQANKDDLLLSITDIVQDAKRDSDKLRGIELILRASGMMQDTATVNVANVWSSLPKVDIEAMEAEYRVDRAEPTPSEPVINTLNKGGDAPKSEDAISEPNTGVGDGGVEPPSAPLL